VRPSAWTLPLPGPGSRPTLRTRTAHQPWSHYHPKKPLGRPAAVLAASWLVQGSRWPVGVCVRAWWQRPCAPPRLPRCRPGTRWWSSSSLMDDDLVRPGRLARTRTRTRTHARPLFCLVVIQTASHRRRRAGRQAAVSHSRSASLCATASVPLISTHARSQKRPDSLW
jgi:hypothetical protein